MLTAIASSALAPSNSPDRKGDMTIATCGWMRPARCAEVRPVSFKLQMFMVFTRDLRASAGRMPRVRHSA